MSMSAGAGIREFGKKNGDSGARGYGKKKNNLKYILYI